MFWIWAVVIVEGLVIVGLCDWIMRLDRITHERLTYLEDKVSSLRTELSGKVDKSY